MMSQMVFDCCLRRSGKIFLLKSAMPETEDYHGDHTGYFQFFCHPVGDEVASEASCRLSPARCCECAQ